MTVCEGTTPDDAELFEALSGVKDEGGVWTVSGNVHTYKVSATSPCTDDATATVTVIEQAQPNAGTDGTELTVCANTTMIQNCLQILGGVKDEGGVWTIRKCSHLQSMQQLHHVVMKLVPQQQLPNKPSPMQGVMEH